jgi:hypothetical protein
VRFGSARITASGWHISQVTKRRAAGAPIAAPTRKRSIPRSVCGLVIFNSSLRGGGYSLSRDPALDPPDQLGGLVRSEHAAVPRWVASFLYSMCSCRSLRLTASSVLPTAACSSRRRVRAIVSAFR